jgi:hypothetical protein
MIHKYLAPCALVFFISLIMLVGVTLAWGSSRKFNPGADSEQYMAIGQSLASGNGFKNPVSPWPNLPDYARMPGWPAIISFGIRVAPSVTPEAVTRYSNAVCLSLAGAFFCALSTLLGAARKFSTAAGLSVSLSPSLVYLSIEGMSEISFVMIISMGLTALLASRRWLYPASVILGTAALVRSNFILVPLAFLFLVFLLRSNREECRNQLTLTSAILACLLAATPAVVWTLRNAEVTGRPLLSSIEGETFYGSNNAVTANNLEYWGYWVMPDNIPGEVPKLKLAHQLGSDMALSDYYHQKGIAWLSSNVSALPRLELGKFVRAFVPIPWIPHPASYAAFFCRFLLYVLWVVLFPLWWPHMRRTYLLFCLALAITHLITTALYYGVFRFTHCYIEIFFVPCIALGLQQWSNRRLRHHEGSGQLIRNRDAQGLTA